MQYTTNFCHCQEKNYIFENFFLFNIMETPYKRLKYIADKYYKNLSNLSVQMGKSRQFFSSYSNKKGIGDKILAELQKNFKINPRYIQYGDQPIFLNDEEPIGLTREQRPDNSIMHVDNIRIGDMRLSKDELERLSKIKLYSVSAQAYEAKILCDFSDIPVSFIPLSIGIPLDPDKYIAVRVSGLSMKDAGISDGDIILVDTSRKDIINGRIYLLSLNGLLMVKRVVIKDGIIHLE